LAFCIARFPNLLDLGMDNDSIDRSQATAMGAL
jgi:hypothetical protein